MRTVILCGGRGTRAHPLTVDVPKPLLPVAGVPVLRRLMEVYAGQGHREFVLAAGFRADLVEEFAAVLPAEWDVTVVDTGLDAGTGERIAGCRRLLGGTFFATYGDGLADVDLSALLAAHRGHGGWVTLTTVPLRSPYGTVEVAADGRVSGFTEKPVLPDRWINGGFFVFDEAAFSCWPGGDLEREVLPALAAAGRLHAHRHAGFWRSVDTAKDLNELSALAEQGRIPWQSR